MLASMWRNEYGEQDTATCLLCPFENIRPKGPEWVPKDIQWLFPTLNYFTVIFSTSMTTL